MALTLSGVVSIAARIPSPPMAGQDRVPRIVFGLSLLFLVLLFGIASTHFGFFPGPQLAGAMQQGTSLFAMGERNVHLVPVRHAEAGVQAPQPGKIAAGLTLVTSLWDDLGGIAGARLLDAKGEVLHTWPVDPETIWAEEPYTDSVAGQFRTRGNYLHGSYLFADSGDLVVNVEFQGLVRMRADGEVVWTLNRRTHHSIDRADDGSFWVSAARMVDDQADALARFPGLATPLVEDLLLRVSADGEVLQEISMLEVLFASRYRACVGQPASPAAASGDVLHLNDVESLPAALADEYPLFEVGDLLVSLRDLHMVLVLHPQSGEIRWMEDSLWMRQHDPDFAGDGWITLFDNNPDEFDGALRGGSKIVRIRPHTGEFEAVHPTKPGAASFFTKVGGKQQRLANGNLLLTEAQGGRVLEVDPAGALVWEWVKEPESDGEVVAEVMEGTRYAVEPAEVRAW